MVTNQPTDQSPKTYLLKMDVVKYTCSVRRFRKAVAHLRLGIKNLWTDDQISITISSVKK
jgi:hypothetical protein